MPRVKIPGGLLFALTCIGVFAYVFSYAWVTEDAYITFRVIDNFVHGYGLRWNIDERVQVYTHPLWMLVHIPFYALFGNIFWVSIGISAIAGTASILLLLKSRPASRLHRVVLVLVPLVLSQTFDNYVICGLEVPLVFFMLGWFSYTLSKTPENIYRLFFIAALCALTRLDTIILLFPTLLWLSASHYRRLHLGKILLAVSPLLCWFLFCLFYYGFLLPNTKYAKLDTGIDMAAYLRQGHNYLKYFFYYDTVAFVWIIMALLLSLTQLPRKGTTAPPFAALLGIGVVASLAYIIFIGGDFMMGRFFAPALFMSVCIVYEILSAARRKLIMQLFLATCICFAVQADIITPILKKMIDTQDNSGVIDERKYYSEGNTLFPGPDLWLRRQPTFRWVEEGENDKIIAETCNISPYITFHGNIGMYGYYAGPGVIVIDNLALSDPLLARLPVANFNDWRIGHFMRDTPPGYEFFRQTGDFSQMPPALAAYYRKLRLVTSGNLLDKERLWTIFGFQLGWYDAWRDEYVKTLPR